MNNAASVALFGHIALDGTPQRPAPETLSVADPGFGRGGGGGAPARVWQGVGQSSRQGRPGEGAGGGHPYRPARGCGGAL